jgi:hypothetical protein
MTMSDVEPTPEDYEAARKSLERPPEQIFLDVAARVEARKRIEREHEERRRRLLRRLLPFRRTA